MMPMITREDNDREKGLYTATNQCPQCDKVITAKIAASDLWLYQNEGEHVQVAFPYLSTDEREALFLSGVCGKCWDDMFNLE